MLLTLAPSIARTMQRMATKRRLKTTPMGERILTFMHANGITNHSKFAEEVLAISKQRFHAWLYTPIDPENVSAAPLLRCAEALSTNPEYLLCVSNDPRPGAALELPEYQLLEAYRVLPEDDKSKLLAIAADWVSRTTAPASAAAPFRVSAKSGKAS